ncbi:MAG TPA: hypothetical protein VGI61_03775, partial [Parafilimonas sp.]
MMNIEAKSLKKSKTIPATNGKLNGSNGRLATQHQTKYAKDVDVKSLRAELKNTIEGEVRFDNGSRALYATDASNYRQVPIGVVIPKNENDILQTINICRK